MNNIVFLTAFCGEKLFKTVSLKSLKKPNYSSQTFNGNFYIGMKENGINIKVLSYLPIASFPGCSLRYVHHKIDTYNDDITILSFLNYQFIKQIGIFASALISLIREVLGGKKIIVCDYMYLPTCLASVIVALVMHKKAFLIIPDIAELIIGYMGVDKRIPSAAVKIYLKMLSFIVRQFDGYILFSEAMKDSLKLDKKPTIIIEGIFKDQESAEQEAGQDNCILYTGGLYQDYGILELIKSLEFIDDSDIEIHFCGAGPLKEEIEHYAKKNERIKYLGLLPIEITIKLQRKAKILINPRKPVGLYTKYSFPSKTFEYLYSGKPVAMTKLDGVPEVYRQFYFIINEVTPRGIATTINNILNTSEEELQRKGSAARDFIAEYKTPKVQTQKIIEFIDKVS